MPLEKIMVIMTNANRYLLAFLLNGESWCRTYQASLQVKNDSARRLYIRRNDDGTEHFGETPHCSAGFGNTSIGTV